MEKFELDLKVSRYELISISLRHLGKVTILKWFYIWVYAAPVGLSRWVVQLSTHWLTFVVYMLMQTFSFWLYCLTTSQWRELFKQNLLYMIEMVTVQCSFHYLVTLHWMCIWSQYLFLFHVQEKEDLICDNRPENESGSGRHLANASFNSSPVSYFFIEHYWRKRWYITSGPAMMTPQPSSLQGKRPMQKTLSLLNIFLWAKPEVDWMAKFSFYLSNLFLCWYSHLFPHLFLCLFF